MIKNKLNQEQEREIAIAYLCGARSDTLQELYGISRSTIGHNIVGKRSHEWDAGLVEFYRESYPENKGRNFAHMFLTFNTDRDYEVLPTGLIIHPKDSSVADVVEDIIYKPGIEEVFNRTALREYVDRQTSYDNLISSVFGLSPKERAEDISRKIFVDLLKRDYSSGKDIFLKDVFDETEDIIIDKVRDGGLAWTPSKKRLVHESFDGLTKREIYVLGVRYGLDGYEGPKTLREIGKVFGVGKGRINQNEAKALRRLRHPSRSKNMMFLCGLATDEDTIEHIRQVLHQEDNDFLDKRVDELKLSVRAANCLRWGHDDITTIGDLIQKSEREMLRAPNFGRKSLNELRERLAQHGLHFGMDISSFLQKQKTGGSE